MTEMSQFKQFLAEQQFLSLIEQIENDAMLMESIVDYFARVVAKIKNTEGVPSGLDLAQLALYITALKIIGNPDHRAAFTKDDIGVNASDVKEVYGLLNAVKADGTQDANVEKVLTSIAKSAQTEFKKNLAVVSGLKSDEDAERTKAVTSITKLYTNLQQVMNKLKNSQAVAK